MWDVDPVYLQELMESGDLCPEQIELVQKQRTRFRAPPGPTETDPSPSGPKGPRKPVVIDMERDADGCYHAGAVREKSGEPGIEFETVSPIEVLGFVFGGGAGCSR